MPYCPVPNGVSSVIYRSRDAIPFETRDPQGKLVASGTEFTSNYGKSSGSKARVKGAPVTLKGKKWSPCRDYTRTAQSMSWSGFCKEVQVLPLSAAGNLRVWLGPSGPGSIWSPADSCVVGASTTNVTVSGSGVGTLTTNGRNRVNTQLLQKAGQRKVNYGEALGEGRQTLSMIAQTSKQVLRAFIAIRKGQFMHAAGILGLKQVPKGFRSMTAANAWLSIQYGWKPLLSDIYDSSKLLQNGLTKGPQLFSVKTFWDEHAEIQNSDDFFQDSTTKSSIKLGGKMWFRINDQTLSSLNQVGLINPLEVAWAVLPWSFVIDWFLPVGNVLEAFSARVGLDFVDGYYGVRCEHTVEKTRWSRTTAGFKPVASNLQASVSTFSYKRTKMTSLPWPGLYYKSPFSSSHVLSALALIRSLKR